MKMAEMDEAGANIADVAPILKNDKESFYPVSSAAGYPPKLM